MSQKPSNIEEYIEWLLEEHSVKIDSKIETHYESVAERVRRSFEKSDYWDNIKSSMTSMNEKYTMETGSKLFIRSESPQIDIKSFNSFLDKTFRKNVLYNNKWPNPPHDGWLLPPNWFSRINDIVRTFFTVKYLDGVEFLTDRLEEIANEADLKFKKFHEAREEGYYAVHTYTDIEFEIPKKDFDTERRVMSIEIQITTQLQEVIRKLLHRYYEEKRTSKGSGGKKWQWEYDSEEFSANYLGHILHYIEGMIVEIRNK